MKTLFLSFGLALTGLSLQAQSGVDGKAPMPKVDRHDCIMASNDTWTSLGLSADQVKQVSEVQTSCKKEHEMTKADDAEASVARHEEKLKGILTPEQYAKWSKWCTERSTSATKPKAEMAK